MVLSRLQFHVIVKGRLPKMMVPKGARRLTDLE